MLLCAKTPARKGFVLLGVLVLFAVLSIMMFVLSKLEANTTRRVQYWRDQNRLEALAASACEVAKARLLNKAEAAKGVLESGDDSIAVVWSIEAAENGSFLIKGHARSPAKGPIRLQGEAASRFTRKVNKDEVRLIPAAS